MVLEFDEIRSVVESGGRVKVRRVNGKPYLYLVYPDGRERCAGRLDRYPDDVKAWIESVRRPRSGPRVQNKQEAGVEGEREHKAQQQEEPRVRVEGDRVIEVELETIWNVRRIALDPRVYILYAYVQKLGYTGSLGEFVSDCTILYLKERGIEVMLKLPEGGGG